MKILTAVIAAGIVGIFVLASFAIVNAVKSESIEETFSEAEVKTCGYECGNSCTESKNCGNSECGIVSKKGPCGCR